MTSDARRIAPSPYLRPAPPDRSIDFWKDCRDKAVAVYAKDKKWVVGPQVIAMCEAKITEKEGG